MRGVSVRSASLGVSGQCDVLEYHRSPDGIVLPDLDGFWQPYPVEYKRGEPKETDEDRLQLCGQAMCLEEMLCCDVPQGALYYGLTHRREQVLFTEALRGRVREALLQMHDLFRRGHTPVVKLQKACNACSLREICLPKMLKAPSVSVYLSEALREET